MICMLRKVKFITTNRGAMLLKGYSGCKVELLDGIVKKTSKSIPYNERLLKQIKKQQSFSHPKIKTPEVLDIGFKDKLLYFDMEYIRGESFTDYCSYSKFSSIKNIFSELLSKGAKSSSCIKSKIIEKCSTLQDFPMEILDSVSWEVPDGFCHGDLTFENIIIKDEQIYLIDFLDSFAEAPLIDEGKLMQDTFSAWSYRNKSYVPWHNLRLLHELLENKRSYITLLIHLYRILPYASAKDSEYISCKIQRVIEKL